MIYYRDHAFTEFIRAMLTPDKLDCVWAGKNQVGVMQTRKSDPNVYVSFDVKHKVLEICFGIIHQVHVSAMVFWVVPRLKSKNMFMCFSSSSVQTACGIILGFAATTGFLLGADSHSTLFFKLFHWSKWHLMCLICFKYVFNVFWGS